MPRLFIVIDPPPGQRERIKSICTGLAGARWMAPEQIHLTLRFIGEVDEALFRKIIANLAAVETEPLILKIRGIDQFPPRRLPRILWLGLEKNEQLVRLRNRIEATLIRSGLDPEDRKFAPHITIARFKKVSRQSFSAFMAANELFELPAFTVREFHLYSSRISSSGAIHQLEASYPIATLYTARA